MGRVPKVFCVLKTAIYLKMMFINKRKLFLHIIVKDITKRNNSCVTDSDKETNQSLYFVKSKLNTRLTVHS